MALPLAPVRALIHWPEASQQGSRRNAMIASTRLAQRRAERVEVEEFLRGRSTPREMRGPSAHF